MLRALFMTASKGGTDPSLMVKTARKEESSEKGDRPTTNKSNSSFENLPKAQNGECKVQRTKSTGALPNKSQTMPLNSGPRPASSETATGSPKTRPFISLARFIGVDRERKETEAKRPDGEEVADGDDMDDLQKWGVLVAGWEQNPKAAHLKARELIEKQGVPDALRGIVWPLLAGSLRSEAKAEYPALLSQSSPFERLIEKDIDRTFPEHAYFSDHAGTGQETLFKVVKTVSVYDADMGYCQGLAFIAGLFLMKMPEEDAFALLLALMNKYKLRELFMPGMPLLEVAHFQFKALLHHYLPKVATCVEREGVHPSSYITQWFMTLFAAALPLPMVFRVVDLLLAFGNDQPTGGLEVLYRVALAVLYDSAEELMATTMDGIMHFFRVEMRNRYRCTISSEGEETVNECGERVLKEAMAISIPPSLLEQLRLDFVPVKNIEDARQRRIQELLGQRDELDQKARRLQLRNDAIREQISAEQAQSRAALSKMEKQCLKYEQELAVLKKQHKLLLHVTEKSEDECSAVPLATLDGSSRPLGNDDTVEAKT